MNTRHQVPQRPVLPRCEVCANPPVEPKLPTVQNVTKQHCHLSFCSEYERFRSSRPTAEHKLAFRFPVDKPFPEMFWVHSRSSPRVAGRGSQANTDTRDSSPAQPIVVADGQVPTGAPQIRPQKYPSGSNQRNLEIHCISDLEMDWAIPLSSQTPGRDSTRIFCVACKPRSSGAGKEVNAQVKELFRREEEVVRHLTRDLVIVKRWDYAQGAGGRPVVTFGNTVVCLHVLQEFEDATVWDLQRAVANLVTKVDILRAGPLWNLQLHPSVQFPWNHLYQHERSSRPRPASTFPRTGGPWRPFLTSGRQPGTSLQSSPFPSKLHKTPLRPSPLDSQRHAAFSQVSCRPTTGQKQEPPVRSPLSGGHQVGDSSLSLPFGGQQHETAPRPSPLSNQQHQVPAPPPPHGSLQQGQLLVGRLPHLLASMPITQKRGDPLLDLNYHNQQGQSSLQPPLGNQQHGGSLPQPQSDSGHGQSSLKSTNGALVQRNTSRSLSKGGQQSKTCSRPFRVDGQQEGPSLPGSEVDNEPYKKQLMQVYHVRTRQDRAGATTTSSPNSQMTNVDLGSLDADNSSQHTLPQNAGAPDATTTADEMGTTDLGAGENSADGRNASGGSKDEDSAGGRTAGDDSKDENASAGGGTERLRTGEEESGMGVWGGGSKWPSNPDLDPESWPDLSQSANYARKPRRSKK